MSFPLRYCPRGDEILPRLRRLFVERDQGLILASMGLPSPALAAFARQHPAGHCDYPDPQERLAFWDAPLRERVPVEDDALPAGLPRARWIRGSTVGCSAARCALSATPTPAGSPPWCRRSCDDWADV